MARQFEIKLFGKPILETRTGSGTEIRSQSDPVHQLIRERWLQNIYGSSTKTGKIVNEDSAVGFSAVWSCVQVLTNILSMVSLNVYKREKDSRSLQADHPNHLLIHTRPNAYMNSFTWRRASMYQCALSGNSYSEIIRNPRSARPEAIELFARPRDVEPHLVDRMIWYKVRGRKDLIPQENMLHFMWITPDGITGKSPITVARENIGQALAMQDYGSKIFTTGVAKRTAVKTPGKLTPDQKKDWRELWTETLGGIDNLHNLAFLEGGAELVDVGLSPEDAQFIQVAKFKIEEMARIYNMPLHMIQSMDHATNNNIEHQSMDLVTYTMMPHFVNWEQEMDYKLFGLGSPYYTKFVVNSLLRADAKTRAEWYRTMQDLGNYSINDVRAKEDENPVEGGDDHYVQVNRIPISKMDQYVEKVTRHLTNEALKRTNGETVETQ